MCLAVITLMPALPQASLLQEQNARQLSFEVASVKPVVEPYLQTKPTRRGGRFLWTTDLWYMIGYAYQMQPYRISGQIPGSDHIYALEATFDAAASDDDVREMLRALLVNRFKMTSHIVTKDLNGYGLSVASGGLKLREVQTDDKPPSLPDWIQKGSEPLDFEGRIFTLLLSRGVRAITARRVSLQQFCEELQKLLGIPVIDQTGVKGNFYFSFRYAQPAAAAEVPLPALSTAIAEELGLKLSRQRGPVEMLVVDHIEKVPTAN
jgi:uncharacterized protein (TIGR03435 family)